MHSPTVRRLLTVLLLSRLAQARPAPAPLRVAAYNLRFNNPGDGPNAWPNRKEMVQDLVRYYYCDVFGTQQALRGQLTDLAELRDYAFVGRGRDDGRGASKLMVREIAEISGNALTICVGDFNSTPNTKQIQTLQTRRRDA